MSENWSVDSQNDILRIFLNEVCKTNGKNPRKCVNLFYGDRQGILNLYIFNLLSAELDQRSLHLDGFFV